MPPEGIVCLILLIVAGGALCFSREYDADGTVQNNKRMRRKRNRYRRKNDLPWGGPTPWDD